MVTRVPLSTKLGMPRSVIKRSDILVSLASLNFNNDNAFLIDPTQLQTVVDQFPVLGMAVDNSLNPNPLFIKTAAAISETFAIPALSCARLPFESGQPAKLECYSAAMFAGTVQVTLMNYVPAPCVWYPQGISINSASTLNVANALLLPIPNSFQQHIGYPAAAGLPTIPAGAARALIYIEGQNVRWTDDGTVPTANYGQRLIAGSSLPYAGPLANLKFIEEAASATLDVSYYQK